MKRYKVQWAYPLEVSSISIHNRESTAAGEVGYLLGTWILRDLQDFLIRGREFEGEQHPEFFEGLEYLVPQIGQLMQAGKVWDAYDLWEDFYLRFQNEFGKPLYAKLPTVIVEGSPETGLKNKIPFIERTSVSPYKKYEKKGEISIVMNRRTGKMREIISELKESIPAIAQVKGVKMVTMEDFLAAIDATVEAISDKYPYQDEASENQFLAEFREGILRRLFPKKGGSLGALKSWLVQYADFGGASHAGRHTNEERAKQDAGDYLMRLVKHLGMHAGSEAISGRNRKYVKSATELVERMHYLLSDDMVWRAYLEYKEFEHKWSPIFHPFPLEMSIGTMRVIPTPEPEPL